MMRKYWETASLLALVAVAVAIPAAAVQCVRAQDSTYQYGRVEQSRGWGGPHALVLDIDGKKHSLVFESERGQDAARDLTGKSVRVLARPVYLGRQDFLLVLTIRPLDPKRE